MSGRLLIAALFALLPVAAQAAGDFAHWKKQFAARLLRDGFKASTVSTFLATAHYREAPLRAQSRQPEKIHSFVDYRNKLLTPQRIADGQQALREHGKQLAATARRYGVERELLAALWGIETSYGRIMGKQPVIASLATLAYSGRRQGFFEKELLAVLRIMETGQLQADRLTGSWAGAMGHFQFIPTTYERFGTDGDGDARVDLCGSYPDALASAGNYLHVLGWQLGDARIEAVDAKADQKLLQREEENRRYQTAAYWKQAGLLPESYPNDTTRFKLVSADGGHSGVYLVAKGFDRLMEWNRSSYFALTVLLLADQLAATPAPAIAGSY